MHKFLTYFATIVHASVIYPDFSSQENKILSFFACFVRGTYGSPDGEWLTSLMDISNPKPSQILNHRKNSV